MICWITGCVIFLIIGWSICRASADADIRIEKIIRRDRFYSDVLKRCKEN